eukprot:scaffold765_cov160-Amphora_coffeaeformis.AAC.16
MAASVARRVASRVSSFFPIEQAAVCSILLPGQDKVICRWWRGKDAPPVVDPARYLIDGQGKLTEADVNPNSTLASEMLAKYADTGLCHVSNTGLTDMRLQRDLARILIGNESEYEGGANARGRDVDLGNVYDIGAPLSAALHYHHEMTYKQHSVTKLGFLCRHAVNRGTEGWSYVSDSLQAHDTLMATELGHKLKERGLCFVRRMTDREGDYQAGGGPVVYNHWQQSWMTDDHVEAEKKAREQGLKVNWTNHPQLGRLMETRYYASAFEYVEELDRNLLVTSIADDGEWFDSWPGIEDVPQEDRPLEMLFGDDTPFSLEEKQLWTDTYDNFGIPLRWQDGDVAVLCNMRYAHGRPGVHLQPDEQRELGVMLGPFVERKMTREDKW